MRDSELIRDFMRVETTASGTHLEVAAVDWEAPAHPVLHWRTFRRWHRPPSPERIVAAQDKALQQPRFFRVCELCEERNNPGHMHDRRTCQGCAQARLGVVC
jgi:hypothetical protein